MHFRDKMFLLVGFLIVLLGSVLTFFWNLLAGLISLLLLAYMCLTLLVLQRKQIARVQQRTLALVKWTTNRETMASSGVENDYKQSTEIPTKRIIGILQAQQMSMERLSRKVESNANGSDDSFGLPEEEQQ